MGVGPSREINEASILCADILESVENPFGNDRQATIPVTHNEDIQHAIGGRIGPVIKQRHPDDPAHEEQPIVLQLVQHPSFYLSRAD
jgi:hypothetical protein